MSMPKRKSIQMNSTVKNPMTNFKLQRNAMGRLTLTDAAGIAHENVVPVHAFPISAPDQGIALVSQEGRELVWIDNMARLTEEQRQLIAAELGKREFMPEILRIVSASTFATPSIWEVETDRGATQLVLKGEDNIRRLERTSLLIADSNGIQFRIRDTQKLDKTSKRILDRFL